MHHVYTTKTKSPAKMDERRQLGPYLTRAHGMTMLSDAGRKLLSEGGQQ